MIFLNSYINSLVTNYGDEVSVLVGDKFDEDRLISVTGIKKSHRRVTNIKSSPNNFFRKIKKYPNSKHTILREVHRMMKMTNVGMWQI